MKKPLLISVRDKNDPMVQHERSCFEARAGLEMDVIFAVERQLGEHVLEDRPALFFGGSGAYSVTDSDPWIREALDFFLLVVDKKVPAYASCFAFQGLALAMGGEVSHDPDFAEMGIVPVELSPEARADSLFGALPASVPVCSGHNDHVSRLPAGVTAFARGELVKNQAFKVNGAPFWASQFHPELTKADLIVRWNFYRDEFTTDPDEIAATDGVLNAAPETPEVNGLIRALLSLA
ncbi:MAG: type 1 glutamine amidotransferase [Myxococcota bacterium]|nr:type 1 glutamine amidotransferase [Myxococcota bacterium]